MKDKRLLYMECGYKLFVQEADSYVPLIELAAAGR